MLSRPFRRWLLIPVREGPRKHATPTRVAEGPSLPPSFACETPMSPRVVRAALPLVMGLLVPLSLAAQFQGLEPRVEAGKNLSAPGVLFTRPAADRYWQALEPQATIHSR